MRPGKTFSYLLLLIFAFTAMMNNSVKAAKRSVHITADYKCINIQIEHKVQANSIKLDPSNAKRHPRISFKIKKYRRRFILPANNKFTPENVCILLKYARPGPYNETIKRGDYLAIKSLLSGSLELKNCAILI